MMRATLPGYPDGGRPHRPLHNPQPEHPTPPHLTVLIPSTNPACFTDDTTRRSPKAPPSVFYCGTLKNCFNERGVFQRSPLYQQHFLATTPIRRKWISSLTFGIPQTAAEAAPGTEGNDAAGVHFSWPFGRTSRHRRLRIGAGRRAASAAITRSSSCSLTPEDRR